MITTQFPLLTEYPGDMPDKINMTAKEYAVAVFALFDWYTKVYLPEENTRRETYDAMTTEMNLLYDVVMNQAVDGGYTQVWIDTHFMLNPNTTSTTVTVGPGGNYATINEALAYLTKKYLRMYESGGTSFKIYLLSGYILNETIYAKDIDLSWIEISGADSETTINSTNLLYAAFRAKNAKLPVLSQLFTMTNTKSAIDGILLDDSSSINISFHSGVKNCTGFGIQVKDNSNTHIYFGIFTGATSGCVLASGLSTVNCRDIDASNCLGTSAIDANTGSTINCENAIVNSPDCTNGIYASSASNIDARGSNVTAATAYKVKSGSTITIESAVGDTTTNQAVNTLTRDGIIYS